MLELQNDLFGTKFGLNYLRFYSKYVEKGRKRNIFEPLPRGI